MFLLRYLYCTCTSLVQARVHDKAEHDGPLAAAHGLQGVHLHHLRPAVQMEALSRSVHTQSSWIWQEGSMAEHRLQGVHLHHLRPAVQVETLSRSVHTQSSWIWQEGSMAEHRLQGVHLHCITCGQQFKWKLSLGQSVWYAILLEIAEGVRHSFLATSSE